MRAVALAACASVAVVCTLAACASRIDANGSTRVGVGLWGLGDPPVTWNLDWPRRDIPELPPTTYPELPPRPPAELQTDPLSGTIDEIRSCATRRELILSSPVPPGPGADRRGGDRARC